MFLSCSAIAMAWREMSQYSPSVNSASNCSAQQPSLGQQGAVLLNLREEVRGMRSACGNTTASPNRAPTLVPPM